VQIALLGDIMIQGPVAKNALRDDGEELVRRLKEVIAPADVAIGNFETFVCPPSCRPGSEWHSPPEAARMVARAGFDAVSVVSSHAWDHGAPAIRHTLGLLAAAGVEAYGLGDASGADPAPVVIERQGVRIGLLGYATASTLTNRTCFTGLAPSAGRIAADVARLRGRSDVVIVSLHHGFGEYPSPEHRNWAKAALQAGADAFVTHHSHMISGVERIGRGAAAYGLANVVAALDPPKPDNICLRLEVRQGHVVDWSYDVFFLDDRGLPRPGSEEEQRNLRERIEKINEALTGENYARWYWSTFSPEDRSAYLRSWRRDIRTYGIGTVFAKLGRLRAHHLRLLWHMAFRR